MNVPMRHRFPAGHRDTTALLVLLSGIAGMIAVVSVVAAITLWLRLDGEIARVDRLAVAIQAAGRANFDTRRSATLESCLEREQLKRDLRLVLTRFHIGPSKLPLSADGRPVLSPIAEGCTGYVRRTVPQAANP